MTLNRAIQTLRLRMIELQIAMIEDYRKGLDKLEQINDAWLLKLREEELMLAAELEGIRVVPGANNMLLIEMQGMTFLIPRDPVALAQVTELIEEAPDVFQA